VLAPTAGGKTEAMALAVQTGGIPRPETWTWLKGSAAFSQLSATDRDAVIDHMLAEDILTGQQGRLWLGPQGEKQYGRANFRELYAVFSSPRLIIVRHDTQEIGQLQAQFLAALESPEGYSGASFTLAGRAWLVEHIDWQRGLCIVRPAPAGRAPRWNGGARWLSYDLCQAMRRILTSDEIPPTWSKRAQDELATQRAGHAFLRDSASPLVESKDELTWWNFAGGGANLLLAQILEHELGPRIIARNTSLTFKGSAAKSSAAIREVLAALRAESRPSPGDAIRFAEGAKRGRLSKFEPCLPDEQLQRYFAETIVDREGALRTLR